MKYFTLIFLKIADEFVKTAVGDNGRVGDQQVVPRFAVMLPLKPGGNFAPVDGCFFFGLHNLVAHLICRFGFDHVFGVDGFDDEIRQVTVHLSIVVRIFDVKDFSGAVVVDFEPFLHGRRALMEMLSLESAPRSL